MKSGWRIGSLFGIPLFLDPSWFFIFVLVVFIYSAEWRTYDVTNGMEWVVGLCMALLLFASVLLHELGHSVIAMSQGITVHSITLFLFGGIASIERESKTPGKAFQVAIAGPAVSLGLFVGLTFLTDQLSFNDSSALMLERLASINLILAIFNLMPGLPLDGGQVLKSLIWKVTGNRIQGLRWAARTGQLLGWFAGIVGIGLYLMTFEPILLWATVVGWFGIRNARAYARVADVQETILELTAADAMRRGFRVVDGTLLVQNFIQNYLDGKGLDGEGLDGKGLDGKGLDGKGADDRTVYFAASDGRYQGWIDLGKMGELERRQWDTLTLKDIAIPLVDRPSVREPELLIHVIRRLDGDAIDQITVLSPADAVAGVINRGDVVTCVMNHLNLALPPGMLQSMQETQDYPASLPLGQLARTMLHD